MHKSSRPVESGTLNHSWVDHPAALRRYSPFLADAYADGIYLTAWPYVARIVSLLAFAIGLISGATHWTPSAFGVISEPGIVFAAPGSPTYVTIFAQSLPFLIATAFIGAISARAGLFLVLGYALGDYLIAGPQFAVPSSGAPVALFGLSNPFLTAFCYLRVPQLIMYVLLFLLAVMPTLITGALIRSLRQLIGYIRGLRRLVGRYVRVQVTEVLAMDTAGQVLLVVGRIILLCAVQGYLVYYWTVAAPMVMRIPWLWAGLGPPIPVFIFLGAVGSWVTNAAIAGMAGRGVLVVLANRHPDTRQRYGQLLVAQAAATKRPAWPRRLPQWVGPLVLAGLISLLLSGFDSSPMVGLYVFAGTAALLVLHSSVLPLLPMWRAWSRLVGRLPPIAWLILLALVIPALAEWYFDYAPGASVQVNTAAGSFGAQIVAMGLGLGLAVVLLPGGDGVWPSGGRPVQATRGVGRRRLLGRLTSGTVSFSLLEVVFDIPKHADAQCLDPHCCFNVQNGLAALVVGGTVLLVSTLALILFPPSAPGDIGGMDAGGGMVLAGIDALGGFDGLIATIRSAAGVGQAAGAATAATGAAMLMMSGHGGVSNGSSEHGDPLGGESTGDTSSSLRRVDRPGNRMDKLDTWHTNQDVPEWYRDDPRFDDLSRDPAQNNQATEGGRQEAMAGLEAEDQGAITRGITRGPKEIDFYDGNGLPYDVKTPPSPEPGDVWRFSARKSGDSIFKALRETFARQGTNDQEPVRVILDSTYMTDADHAALWQYLKANAQSGELDRIIELVTRL